MTWQYLLMLVGKPGVKADTWVCRFVEGAVGRPVASQEAGTLLHRAAAELEVNPTNLDHAIWSHMSRQRRRWTPTARRPQTCAARNPAAVAASRVEKQRSAVVSS